MKANPRAARGNRDRLDGLAPIEISVAIVFLAIPAFAQPQITAQPRDYSVSLGADVTNQVTAAGFAPLSYQWRFNDEPLLSGTNRSLVLTNLQSANAGNYSVVVSDSSGSVTSQVARLDVDTTFTKITAGSIVNDGGDSVACAWGDYDGDGWLDLFVTNADGQKNFLYHNSRDGSFERITAGSVATDIKNWRGCAWADYDNDGHLDLLVTSVDEDAAQIVLYRNNGNNTFTRMPDGTIGGIVRSGAGYSEQPAWVDYDNDGFLDLFVARNGIDWLFRNDGYLDLYVTNAGVDAQGNFIGQRNFLYHNNGDGSFTRILTGSPANDVTDSVGCAWGDYDNDGFLDLFVANGAHISENNCLYRNNGNGNGWLRIKLVGTVSTRSAVGAKIRVRAVIRGKTAWQLREVSAAGDSQNPLDAHFGLGDATNIDLVRIEWPSGIIQEFQDKAVKQTLTIAEPPRLLVSISKDAAQFSVKGGRGFQYQIEASTDLTAWSSIGVLTITNLAGMAQFVDTNAPGLERRFYRATSH